MRYHEISEARKNPDQNPKLDPVAAVEKYNNSGYYMSYTAIDELGINPRSGYHTPIGIYSYPIIDRIISGIITSKDMSRVPYMGETPYVWIFEPKNRDRGLIISEYTDSDYSDDVSKLFRYISAKKVRIASAFDEVQNRAENESRKQSPAGNIWNFTRVLANLLTGSESLSSYVDTVLNIGDNVTELNKTTVVKIIDVFSDSKEYEIEYPDGDTFIVKFDEVEPVNNESVVLEYQSGSKRAYRDAVFWTYLLYSVLGYDYVDDSSGTGLIHANEPAQAVFFNSSVIKVVSKIDNPNSDTDVNISNIFSHSKTPEEVERIEPSVIETMFRKLLKNKVYNISSQIPIKFMGHVVVNSSKLQAQLLLNDANFEDYFKTINRDTIPIMDNYMIKKIHNIPTSEMENRNFILILNYFNRFHAGANWPAGERAILNKSYNDNNAILIIEYCYRVRKKPWPEAEFIILKQPSSIPYYSEKVLRNRWPEGERVLSRIDKDRGSWILDSYANEFNISVDDIGKI
jgi:hypothetical protein